ncbi:hypothetical protein ACFQFQ_16745 [Sulfitobacter porphyrae]|uniref:Uncharacterized protein n=1 Tax=Sulfitobacter porphyrae TaxID=1246864 RepID=A0ABW2B5F1_9RHOB
MPGIIARMVPGGIACKHALQRTSLMTPEQIFALIAALTAEPDPDAFATLKAGARTPPTR